MNNKNTPKLGIIILNWNNYPDTIRSARSTLTQDYSNFVLYLVDNGSVDTSFDQLRGDINDERVAWIENGANLGFAAGCNTGIKTAISDECDYVLLLNNDCFFKDPTAFSKAVDFMINNPSCGISGGKILFWPNNDVIWSTGGYIRLLGGPDYIGHGDRDCAQYNIATQRSFISGALMLIRREVFQSIGLLPEAYFFGTEDWDFSQHAIRKGFEIWYNPEFVVFHEASNSHDSTDVMYVYNGILSKILYKKRNLGFCYFFWFAMYFGYVFLLLPPLYIFRGERYLKTVSFRDLWYAMRMAVLHSARINKITLNMLNDFTKLANERK